MSTPEELLHTTPEEAVRRIALGLLDQIGETLPRLDDPTDSEALHDFRVGVRRLRSALRTWRGPLGKSAKKKDRDRLRTLQNETGGGRDAEVALEWLEGQSASLRPAHKFGFSWLVQRLEDRKRSAMAHVRSAIRTRFLAIDEKLRERLSTLTLTVHLDRDGPAETFATALATTARQQADEIARRLVQVASVDEAEALHDIRICGKRMRYLLEPAKGALPEVAAVLKTCKKLQDLLGELNDGFVLRAELRQALEDAAVERARLLHALTLQPTDDRVQREMRRTERPGLLELTRRNEERIHALYARIERDWIETAASKLVHSVDALAAALGRLAGGHGSLEIERKYLLSHAPDFQSEELQSLGVTIAEMAQGYLPGAEIRERIRHVRTADGRERFLRTLKAGRGVQRIEVEEPCDRALFDGLWPLTAGARVTKRRYTIPDGDRAWEIDVFQDRDLVLAEIELDSPDEPVSFPSWLAPCIVREVTDEKGFTNLELAS
jgi:CHAD domain-containing protein/CYTH domain-containing protein